VKHQTLNIYKKDINRDKLRFMEINGDWEISVNIV